MEKKKQAVKTRRVLRGADKPKVTAQPRRVNNLPWARAEKAFGGDYTDRKI